MIEAQRKTIAILLKKSMYINVDTGIEFFKVLTQCITESMKMNQSYTLDDNEELMLLVSVIVDDCVVIGMEQNIEWFMTELEKLFKMTKGAILVLTMTGEYNLTVKSTINQL